MEKEAVREHVWDELSAQGLARFPFPPHGRMPNFVGAERAAERLAETEAWKEAEVIKANPDSPQLPVRRAALSAGKTVYMAVPRLRKEECFLELDPESIDDIEAAPTVSHVREFATPVGPREMPAVDLIVAGSVAVTEDGDRIGKGEGYSDLEFGILSEFGLVDASTRIVTTIHEVQLIDVGFPTEGHDVPMDLVATPERVLRTDRVGDRPDGIEWDVVSSEMMAAIPVLQTLQE